MPPFRMSCTLPFVDVHCHRDVDQRRAAAHGHFPDFDGARKARHVRHEPRRIGILAPECDRHDHITPDSKAEKAQIVRRSVGRINGSFIRRYPGLNPILLADIRNLFEKDRHILIADQRPGELTLLLRPSLQIERISAEAFSLMR